MKEQKIAEIYCQRCTQKEDCKTSPYDWECKLTLQAILALIEQEQKPLRAELESIKAELLKQIQREKPMVEALKSSKGKLEQIKERFGPEYMGKVVPLWFASPLWFTSIDDYIKEIDAVLKGEGNDGI